MNFYISEYKKLQLEMTKAYSKMRDDISHLLSSSLCRYNFNYNGYNENEIIKGYVKLIPKELKSLQGYLDKNMICVLEDKANKEFYENVLPIIDRNFSNISINNFTKDIIKIYINAFNYTVGAVIYDYMTAYVRKLYLYIEPLKERQKNYTQLDYDKIISSFHNIYYYSYILMLLNSYKLNVYKIINAERIKILRNRYMEEEFKKVKISTPSIRVDIVQRANGVAFCEINKDLKIFRDDMKNKFNNADNSIKLITYIRGVLSTVDLHDIVDANNKIERLIPPSTLAYQQYYVSSKVMQDLSIIADDIDDNKLVTYFNNHKDWVKNIPTKKLDCELKNNYKRAFELCRLSFDYDDMYKLAVLYESVHTLYLLVRFCREGKIAGLDKLVSKERWFEKESWYNKSKCRK